MKKIFIGLQRTAGLNYTTGVARAVLPAFASIDDHSFVTLVTEAFRVIAALRVFFGTL